MSEESSTIVLSILESVAAADLVDPIDLPPLSDAIDPDALNALFDPSGDLPAPTRFSFPYAGHDVTVTTDGSVLLDRDEPLSPALGGTAGTKVPRTDEPLAE
ncbi:HalOD1 output domain-containing protein [Halosimplex aquaticum]|uniref:HalOD1 output domain-containing protein n=1 Tax=Halosimplex aquaticum TaxID=3026162 RepID=A0ABD5Y7Q3_9EURY|nr:HalOD1 output domain-containing protein [Halosimplex aquaticum]